MNKIFILIFLLVTSLICSCGSTHNSSKNNELISTISSSANNNTISSFPFTKEEQKVIEKDALSMVEFYTRNNSITESSLGISSSFMLKLENDNVVFEVNSDVVELNATNENNQRISGKNIIIGKDILVHFNPTNTKESIFYLGFIDVIAKINENIVGYAIVYLEPYYINNNSVIGVRYLILCSKIFPKINEEYQNISLNYLRKKIDFVKHNINTTPLSDFEGEFYQDIIIDNYIYNSVFIENRYYYIRNDDYFSNGEYKGITFKMLSKSNNTTYFCRIDGKGSFSNDEILLTKTISLDEQLCWYVPKEYTYEDTLELSKEETDALSAFIEFIVYEDNNIIGFGVFDAFYNYGNYTSKILTTVEFPKINGEYQNISLEYVRDRIDEVKTSYIETSYV